MRRTLIVSLTAILIAYLALVQWQGSPAWFGYYHDDSLYWTAAKSLAAGHGYRMPSVPGEPPQTKYPVFFPWMLSWVWHLEPQFPANLSTALWMVALSGAAFLGGSFVLLRQLGLGEGAALFLTAVCGLHPVVVHLGGLLLSDVPFMALAVWSLVFAGVALDRQGTSRSQAFWGAALALAVLACLVRSIGVTLLGGFVLASLWRRCYRPAAVSLALAVAVTLGTVRLGTVRSVQSGIVESGTVELWSMQSGTAPSQAGLSAARGYSSDRYAVQNGYEQNIKFYSSYWDFWKLSTPDWQTFSASFGFNFREMLKQPAIGVFSIPASGFASFGWQLAAIALSFPVVKGMGSLAMAVRHPAFVVLGVYAVVVLAWNYTLMDRFFAWALPLFLAGAWFEIRGLAQTARDTFQRGAPRIERAVAVLVMAVFAALGVYGGYRYLWAAPAAMAAELAERQGLQAEKQQAYAWILQNTGPAERFIASEDASLYLFTGRQALRPMAFSTAAFYLQSEEVLEADLARMTDTASKIGARYWLAAADDYHLESAEEFIQKRSAELLRRQPAVFVSPGGNVRIYDITAITAAAGVVPEPLGTRRTPHGDRTSVSAGIGF